MWSRFFCLPPRFRCEPQLAGDAHRVVPGKTHTLGADYTVRWERVIYRVKREHIAADMRGARVQLEATVGRKPMAALAKASRGPGSMRTSGCRTGPASSPGSSKTREIRARESAGEAAIAR